MISRRLEPEVMDDPSEAEAYDRMDHTEVNRVFVDDLVAACTIGARVIDLGTGTAQIPVELCERIDHVLVMACDAAVSMLEIAKLNVAVAGMEHRIQLQMADAKALGFEDEAFDAVCANSLLHHMADPTMAIHEMVRVTAPDGWIFVRDLARPESEAGVEDLVERYAGEESEYCQQLFRQSLQAALTVEEMQQMVDHWGCPPSTVVMSSDRHWTWCVCKNTLPQSSR